MLKRLLPLGLVVLLLHAAHATPVTELARTSQKQSPVEKVKASVARRVGKKSRVTVKLQDGSKLKGQITQAGDDSFTLTDAKLGQSRTLAYSEVREVKGQGLSTLTKVVLVVGIAAVTLAVVIAVGIATADFRPSGVL